jgi:hypothetical protein
MARAAPSGVVMTVGSLDWVLPVWTGRELETHRGVDQDFGEAVPAAALILSVLESLVLSWTGTTSGCSLLSTVHAEVTRTDDR